MVWQFSSISLRAKLLALFTLVALAVSSGFYIANNSALAQTPEQNLCGGANISLDPGTCPADSGTTISSTIGRVINLISIVVGIVAVIMLIIGGFKYVTSSGDSGAMNSAKNTIIFALVGLVIAALAQVIVRFVLNKVVVP